MSKRIYPKKVGICKQCKGDIIANYSAMSKPNRMFCSYRCKIIWRNKNIPQSEKQRKATGERGKKLYTGIKRSLEFRINNAERNKGEKSHFWKGGLTDNNRKLRNSYKTRLWREKVFKRDNWTCRGCGARSGKNKKVYLEAHHIMSWSKFPKLRFIIKNGITLCKSCHKETDTFGNKPNKKVIK